MLEHLRQKVIRILASAHTVNLASYGPADIQSSPVQCEAIETTLYILVPIRSDHLTNLENHPAVVITTQDWELHGKAEFLSSDKKTAGLKLSASPDTGWSRVITILPRKITIHNLSDSAHSETIDFDDQSKE